MKSNTFFSILLLIFSTRTSGQTLLKDIASGNSSSKPENFIPINNKLLFMANDIQHGRELWITDGTSQGTSLFFDFTPAFSSNYNYPNDTYITGVTLWNNQVYFFVNQYQLWKTDGINPPVKIFELTNGLYSGLKMVTLNNQLFFTAGSSLWKCNGTTVSQVRSFYTTSGTIIVFNNKIYFYTYGSLSGSYSDQLWCSDGTYSGTTFISKIYRGFDFLVYNNGLYFVDIGDTGLAYIGKTDGTSVGTTFIRDMGYGKSVGLYNEFGIYYSKMLFSVNNKILFWGGKYEDRNNGLYTNDGTDAIQGTKFIYKMSWNIYNDIVVYKNNLYFNFQGNEIWKTDGTAVGTGMSWLGKYLYLGPNNTLYAQNLDFIYRYEPNDSFTQLTTQNGSNTSYSEIQKTIIWNGKLFYTPQDNTYGRELWITNLPCQAQVTLNSPDDDILQGMNQSFKALGSIIAINKLANSAWVNYQSEQQVDLKPGFEAKTGSVFKVLIDNCGNN